MKHFIIILFLLGTSFSMSAQRDNSKPRCQYVDHTSEQCKSTATHLNHCKKHHPFEIQRRAKMEAKRQERLRKKQN